MAVVSIQIECKWKKIHVGHEFRHLQLVEHFIQGAQDRSVSGNLNKSYVAEIEISPPQISNNQTQRSSHVE